jgi:hypothetical protein
MAHDRKASSTAVNTAPVGRASRRELLKGLSLAGLAAGSTSLAAVPAQAEPPPVDSSGVQYRENDHIRKFYDLARR